MKGLLFVPVLIVYGADVLVELKFLLMFWVRRE